MPRLSNERSQAMRMLAYRQKNLLKRLSDGWSIAATSSLTGKILSLSLLNEIGQFQAQIKDEDFDTLLSNGFIEGKEAPSRRTHLDITMYSLK